METERSNTKAHASYMTRKLYNHIFAVALLQHVSFEYVEYSRLLPSRSTLRPDQSDWHRFQDELALLCDPGNAGQTVCSIAVEQTSSASLFWIA
ncbi:uncharacterized protein MYCFIDRAFT_205233, partial [Pseudocercospora fijiensis CIRAD86]